MAEDLLPRACGMYTCKDGARRASDSSVRHLCSSADICCLDPQSAMHLDTHLQQCHDTASCHCGAGSPRVPLHSSTRASPKLMCPVCSAAQPHKGPHLRGVAGVQDRVAGNLAQVRGRQLPHLGSYAVLLHQRLSREVYLQLRVAQQGVSVCR